LLVETVEFFQGGTLMKIDTEQGKTLLVDGPASVKLLSGDLSVLGTPFLVDKTLVVRQGKRLPLWVKTISCVEVLLGEGACINEVEDDTVTRWTQAAEELLSIDKPVIVIVIGGIDTGKTSFCTFLVNSALKKNLKTGIIDADLGQSDVGPPLTIGFNFVFEPVNDLFEVDAKDAIFVGSTSPSGVLDKLTFGINYLKDRLLVNGADLIVVNTDGWIIGEEAAEYKIKLVESIAPSVIVGMQSENELTAILDAFVSSKVFIIKSPQLIYPRNREKRKLLRELSYKKYMKGAKMQSLSFRWVKVRNSILGSGRPLRRNLLNILCNMLRVRFLYSEEGVKDVLVVLRKNEKIPEKQIKDAEQYCGKTIKVIWEGDEEGLLVGLLDDQNHFLGIGVLHHVDYKRKILKIYTPVKMKTSSLIFGHVKLNSNFQEVGLSTIYSKNL